VPFASRVGSRIAREARLQAQQRGCLQRILQEVSAEAKDAKGDDAMSGVIAELVEDLDRADRELIARIEEALRALCSFTNEITHSREAIEALHDGVCVEITAALDEHRYQVADAKRRAKESGAS
jgi:hypothetical protein